MLVSNSTVDAPTSKAKPTAMSSMAAAWRLLMTRSPRASGSRGSGLLVSAQHRQCPPSFGHDGVRDSASAISAQRTLPWWAMYPAATASEMPWKLRVSISQSNRVGVSCFLTARMTPRAPRSVRRSSRYDGDPARQQTACTILVSIWIARTNWLADASGAAKSYSQPL